MKWIAENEDKSVVDGRWHRACRSLQGSWLYPEWEGTLGGFGQSSNCRVTEVREGRDGLGSSQGNRGRWWLGIRVMPEGIRGTAQVQMCFKSNAKSIRWHSRCGMWEKIKNQGWLQSVLLWATRRMKLLFTDMGETAEEVVLGGALRVWVWIWMLQNGQFRTLTFTVK